MKIEKDQDGHAILYVYKLGHGRYKDKDYSLATSPDRAEEHAAEMNKIDKDQDESWTVKATGRIVVSLPFLENIARSIVNGKSTTAKAVAAKNNGKLGGRPKGGGVPGGKDVPPGVRARKTDKELERLGQQNLPMGNDDDGK